MNRLAPPPGSQTLLSKEISDALPARKYKRITKAAALYRHPDADAQCENCVFFLKPDRCHLHGPSDDISETGCCGYFLAGPGRSHKFGNVQVQIPDPLRTKIISAGKVIVKESSLAAEGREADPHVTVKFGIHTTDPLEVAKAVGSPGLVKLKIGKLSLFPDSGDGEVLKLDIESEDLHKLNASLSSKLKVTDTHPEYNPHLTIAYVEPGSMGEYIGKGINGITGQSVTIPELLFSTRFDERFCLPLSSGSNPIQVSMGFAPASLVTKEQSGYEEGGEFECEYCKHFAPDELDCAVVDPNSPGDDDGYIDEEAVCNAFAKGKKRSDPELEEDED